MNENKTKETLRLPRNIPPEHINKFTRYCELIKLNDVELQSISTQTLANCLATLYELELSNNPLKRELAIIKYGENLQIQIQEQGFITLLKRSGKVMDFQREMITTLHHFNEETNKWEMSPGDIFKPKNLIGYYGFIQMENKYGKPISFMKAMTKKECENWRDTYAKTKNKKTGEWKVNHIWNTHFDQMSLKTVIKSIARDIDKNASIEFNTNSWMLKKALKLDQAVVVNENEIVYMDNPDTRNNKVTLNELENDK